MNICSRCKKNLENGEIFITKLVGEKVVEKVCLDCVEPNKSDDSGEYGMGGDWWKR